ncbi:hypothetical protein P692DRAFT_20923088 [Suillus brevipes Sb2]|nr:hypothetical protein P692DRAFT_20923088 [Suillus brevipes Sb2]
MKNDKQLPASHQKPVKTFEGHSFHCNFPDGKRIATASANKTIRIRRFEDGAEMMKWQYTYALVLLDDGKQVVSAEGEAPDGVDEGGFDETDFDLNNMLVSHL